MILLNRDPTAASIRWSQPAPDRVSERKGAPMFRPAMLSCVLALSSLSADADVIVVCPDGSGAFTTIQSAIDAALDGDNVVICPGIYHEVINLLGKPISVFSMDSAETTIVDGSGLGAPVVQCVSGETAATRIAGLTITGGHWGMGGGFRIVQSSPTIERCAIVGNESSDEGGGGIYCDAGSPTITDCVIAQNRANGGGGAIFQSGSNPTLLRCEIRENVADAGGGIMLASQSAARIESCAITDNQADLGAAGIRCLDSNPTILTCIIANNTTSSAGAGGGLLIEHGTPWIEGCTLSGNVAGSGGAVACNNSETAPRLQDCLFTGNTATAAGDASGGGAIASGHGASPQVWNCVIQGNRAVALGGAVKLSGGSDARFINCLITGNEAGVFGGGIYCSEWGGNFALLANSTVSDNSAAAGGGLYHDYRSRLTVANSLFWGNQPEGIVQTSGDLAVTYSDVEGGWIGIGNLDADPRFVDPGNGNFRLLPGSPCIDAGDNTAVPDGVDTDLAGLPRFICDATAAQTGNGDAPLVDMGAYEYQIGLGDCASQVSSFDVKYKDRIQGLRIKACLADESCESVGAGWRVTFTIYNGLLQERARVTRNSGCAVAKFPGLVCGDTYECTLSHVQNSFGEDCTPTVRPSEPAIIACLRP